MDKEMIKRLNYFNGQFLKADDFQLEQNYYSKQQRWLNYILFEKSGTISPDDLKIEVNGIAKTFVIKKGMAIGLNKVDKEAKEIVITEDLVPVNLPSVGNKVIVTVHYEENPVDSSVSPEPPSLYRKIAEKAVFEQFVVDPSPATPLPTEKNGDEYIVLGEIDLSSTPPALSSSSEAKRNYVKLRMSLLGLTPGITVSPTQVTAGTNNVVLTVTATGGFDLNGATVSINPLTDISTPNVSINPSGTIMSVQFNVTATAASGNRTLTIRKGITALSGTFDVLRGLELTSIDGIELTSTSAIDYITLNGSGFSSPVYVAFSKGAGTFTPVIQVTSPNVTATQVKIKKDDLPSGIVQGVVRITVGSNSFTSAFEFIPPPTFDPVTPISPTVLSVDEILTINGDQFIGSVRVQFNPYDSSSTRGEDGTVFPSPGLGESVSLGKQLKVYVKHGTSGKVRIKTGSKVVQAPQLHGGGVIECVSDLTIS